MGDFYSVRTGIGPGTIFPMTFALFRYRSKATLRMTVFVYGKNAPKNPL